MNAEAEPDNLIDGGPLDRTPQQEREFEVALRLMGWVKDFLKVDAETEWTLEPGEPQNVFVSTFAKGTKTFRAAVLLCDRGYGQQAGMLCRSLFEHAVISWWLLLCVEDEEWAMEALRQHKDHARVLYFRAAEEHPELEIEAEEEEFDAEYVAALDKRFGRHGGYWHGKRLDQLVREVTAKAEERYARMFWQFFRFVNGHNNGTLHHSSMGIADAVRWREPDETPTVELGPSPKWQSASLFAASAAYGLLVWATLGRLSPAKVEEFSELLDQVIAMFRSLTPEDVEGVGRNDPCPCGSGQKFKRCHEGLVA
jgi:hypothetical protein